MRYLQLYLLPILFVAACASAPGTPQRDNSTPGGDSGWGGDSYTPGCGNGVLDSATGEQCDGSELGGSSCVDLGYASGTLGCNGSCRFDTSGCIQSVCGNGIKEPGEACDGDDVGSDTCQGFGYTAGNLRCMRGCVHDLSTCGSYAGQNCGDGILTGTEMCDGAVWQAPFAAAPTCEELGASNTPPINLGTGQVVCTNCLMDWSGCTAPLDICGLIGAYGDGTCDVCEPAGGVADSDCAMVCGVADGVCADSYDSNVNEWGCAYQGLAADPDCAATCGNGLAEGDEPCDGNDILGDPICADFGFDQGVIACSATCTLDFSSCILR